MPVLCALLSPQPDSLNAHFLVLKWIPRISLYVTSSGPNVLRFAQLRSIKISSPKAPGPQIFRNLLAGEIRSSPLKIRVRTC